MSKSESNVTLAPRFKDWTKPTSVLEALERSLVHARNEQAWTSGSWFDVDFTIQFDYNDQPYPESLAEVTKKIEGMVCTDVKACAAGIIAIEVLDGEALLDYLVNEEDLRLELLDNDPIAWGAIGLLARATDEEFKDDLAYGLDEPSPLERIIARNDRHSSVRDDKRQARRAAHHQRIVKCFERAVELAKEPPVIPSA